MANAETLIHNTESFKDQTLATNIANRLSSSPELLPQFFSEVHAFTGEDIGTAVKAQSFMRAVDAAISAHDWNQETSSPFTSDQAYTLLHTISTLQSSDGNAKLQEKMQRISHSLLYGYISKRFERSGSWKGSLESLYTLAQAAFTDPVDTSIVQTWLAVMNTYVDPINDTIASKSIFLALSDPDPSAESYLRMAVDLQNAKSYCCTTFHKEFQFVESNSYKKYSTILEQGLRIYPKQSAHVEFRDVIAHIHENPERYAALSDAITLHGKFAMHIHKPDSLTEQKTYPYDLFDTAVDISERAAGLLTTVDTQHILYREIADYVRQFEGEHRILGFNILGVAGYIVAPSEDLGNLYSEKEIQDYIVNKIEEHQIVLRLTQNGYVDRSGAIKNVTITDNDRIGFFITQGRFVDVSPLLSALVTQLPVEFRGPKAYDYMSENIRLQQYIAQSFNRSLTRSGVLIDLSEHPNLPYVFSKAHLYAQGEGIFKGLLYIQTPESWQTDESLPPLECTMKFKGGVFELSFENNFENLDQKDILWFMKYTMLQLFYSQCCVTHDDLLTISATEISAGDEERKPKREIAGQIVHLGQRKNGDLKNFTLRATKLHAQAVYGISVPDTMDQDEADTHIRAHGGIPLVDINTSYKQQEHCERNHTWRSAHDPGYIEEPTQVMAPNYLFLLPQ